MLYRVGRGKYRRGFTLTEVAIVLGVVGSILAAIWGAAGRVNEKNKTQRAAAQVLTIVGNYRTLYAQHGIDVNDWTDITCMGVNANFFSADMLLPGTACATNSVVTYPSSPWGSAANGQYVQVQAHRSMSGIVVGYYTLPQAACNELAEVLTAAPDMIWENINGTAQSLPPFAANAAWTPAQINTYCAAGNANYINVMYKAR